MRQNRSRPFLQRIGESALGICALLGIYAVALVMLSLFSGWQTFHVISGSMEPTISIGDLVVTRETSHTELSVGDVVTIEDPQGNTVTHRIDDYTPGEDFSTAVLKGDANESRDPYVYEFTNTAKVYYTIPYLGHLHSVFATKYSLLWFAAALLGFYGLAYPPDSHTQVDTEPQNRQRKSSNG